MKDLTLGSVEMHFAELVWDNEPLSSGELVRLCDRELNWKKSTTYTVLRKLCDRGLFQNQDGVVTALISRAEYSARQSKRFVEENYGGSLPAFLVAFTRDRGLSREDADQLQKLIDDCRRESST